MHRSLLLPQYWYWVNRIKHDHFISSLSDKGTNVGVSDIIFDRCWRSFNLDRISRIQGIGRKTHGSIERTPREIFRSARWENQFSPSTVPNRFSILAHIAVLSNLPGANRSTPIYVTHAWTCNNDGHAHARALSTDNRGVTCWTYRQVTPHVLYSVYPLRRILSVGKFDFSCATAGAIIIKNK